MSKKRPIKVEQEINPNLEVYEVLVLDRSGSMQGVRDITIEQVNKSIAEAQATAKKDGIKTFYSLLLFDHERTLLYNFSPVEELIPLTTESFVPRGSTALNDAIAHAIEELKLKLKGRENDPNIDVTITVFTDGWENCSTKYPGKGNKELFTYIGEIKEAYGWTISFVGAGSPEEIARTAEAYNIAAGSTLSYALTGDSIHDGAAVSSSFDMMSEARLAKRQAFSEGVKINASSYFEGVKPTTNADNKITTVSGLVDKVKTHQQQDNDRAVMDRIRDQIKQSPISVGTLAAKYGNSTADDRYLSGLLGVPCKNEDIDNDVKYGNIP